MAETAKKPTSNRTAKDRRNTLFRVLDGVLSLSHKKIHAEGNSDKAADILLGTKLQHNLTMWGEYRTLSELYIAILQKDHFNNKPLVSSLSDHGIIIGNLGVSYNFLGDAKKAIEYFERALQIAFETGNRLFQCTWLGNLGVAYRNLGETKKAIEYFEEALKLAQKYEYRFGKSLQFGSLGVAYRDLGNAKKAIEYFEQALNLAREIEDVQREGLWLGNLGIAYHDLEDDKKAIGYFAKAYEIAYNIRDRQREANWLRELGVIISKQEKKNKEALTCFLLALQIFTQLGNPKEVAETQSKLKQLEEKFGVDEFNRLQTEVTPKAREILQKTLEKIAEIRQ